MNQRWTSQILVFFCVYIKADPSLRISEAKEQQRITVLR